MIVKKVWLLAFLMMLSVSCAQAKTVQERYEEIVKETELREEREMSREEKDKLYYLLEEANEDTLRKLRNAYVPKEKIYFNNTVCAFGPQFREISKRLTDEWYMFTPIDLSKEGTQTFDLIAGSMYVIGQVNVTVENGCFTVDYAYTNPAIEGGREYFTIFSDYESITRQDLDHFKKRYSYARPYSIEEKLGGDTDVILFVCNTATFDGEMGGIYRYYETNEDREAMRNAMLEMIGR